jgi:predicted acetyltransferase
VREEGTLREADLEIACLRNKKDIMDYMKLVRKVFGQEVGADVLAKKLIDHHPEMTLDNFFVIKHVGTMVSTLNLIPVTWSIGDVKLKIAEMGHVGTLPEYRGRGLIQKLVLDFLKTMEQQNFDLAVIEGIPYFYRQFGYDYALPLLEETRIRLDQIPDSKSNVRIRLFTAKDVAEAMKLLEISQKKFYVHSIRSEAVWETQEKTHIASDPEPFQGYAVEEDGRLTGYFRIRENSKERELLLTEISEVDQLEARAIVDFLKEYGLKKGLTTLVANISYTEPFTEHLVSIGATKRLPTYAWQVRITDYLKIFQKLKPLLESRLAHSMYHTLTETLDFNFRRFTIRLNLQGGKIVDIQRLETGERSPIGLNPLVFVQLLMGYKSREELELSVPDMRIAVSHKNLIDVLFPKLPSYIHSAY